jgi:hypothetical protein
LCNLQSECDHQPLDVWQHDHSPSNENAVLNFHVAAFDRATDHSTATGEQDINRKLRPPFAIAPQNPTVSTATAANFRQQYHSERCSGKVFESHGCDLPPVPQTPRTLAQASHEAVVPVTPLSYQDTWDDDHCDDNCGANVTSSGLSAVMQGEWHESSVVLSSIVLMFHCMTTF